MEKIITYEITGENNMHDFFYKLDKDVKHPKFYINCPSTYSVADCFIDIPKRFNLKPSLFVYEISTINTGYFYKKFLHILSNSLNFKDFSAIMYSRNSCVIIAISAIDHYGKNFKSLRGNFLQEL